MDVARPSSGETLSAIFPHFTGAFVMFAVICIQSGIEAEERTHKITLSLHERIEYLMLRSMAISLTSSAERTAHVCQ